MDFVKDMLAKAQSLQKQLVLPEGTEARYRKLPSRKVFLLKVWTLSILPVPMIWKRMLPNIMNCVNTRA